MNELPDFIDFAEAESEAAALARGLNTRTRGWDGLISIAQTILTYFQDLPDHDISYHERLLDYDYMAPVIAAARIFDAAAQFGRPDSVEEALDLDLQAAVSYGMYGNFATASTVIHRSAVLKKGSSPGLVAVIATCCPREIGVALDYAWEDNNVFQYLITMNRYLIEGGQDIASELPRMLMRCFHACQNPFEQALLLCCRLVLQQVLRLGTFESLTRGGVAPEVARRITETNILTLLPPQQKAIEQGIVTGTANAFVSLPTSAGKTLLGERCLIQSLADTPGIACFIAPYIAVGRHVARALHAHLPAHVTVCELFGSVGSDEQPSLDDPYTAVVATPERFDSILRQDRSVLRRLRCVVIDEAHLVGNDQRGLRLEGLITRLRLLRRQGFGVRLVALSAVISEPDLFCAWLDVPPEMRLIDAWRPTARRIGVWLQTGALRWYQSDDIARPAGDSRISPLGQRTLLWPESAVYPVQQMGGIKKLRPKVYENVAYLTEVLSSDFGPPTLCICSTRAATRVLASIIARRSAPLVSYGASLRKLVAAIEQNYGYLRPLAEMAKRGVAYHNSSLPEGLRSLIEDAVAEMSLRVVTATTTLAEGVDLPFRSTVVVDWLVYREGRERPMPGLLFGNIAGRCGRTGSFTEGDTIIFDNVLGSFEFTQSSVRDRSREQLLRRSPPVRSLLTEELAGQIDPAREAILEAQFVAAIGENPSNDNLADDVASNVFGAFTSEAGRIVQIVRRIQEDRVDEKRKYVFARAASPVQLTERGVDANRTGFAPRSCEAILETLERIQPCSGGRSTLAHLLCELSHLPEQRYDTWKRKLTNHRTRIAVGPEDFENVIGRWMAGDRYADIFADLPAIKRSKRTPSVEAWLRGGGVTDTWADDYDKFVDFVMVVLDRFLPWLVYGCTLLARHAGPNAEAIDWEHLGRLVAERAGASELGYQPEG